MTDSDPSGNPHPDDPNNGLTPEAHEAIYGREGIPTSLLRPGDVLVFRGDGSEGRTSYQYTVNEVVDVNPTGDSKYPYINMYGYLDGAAVPERLRGESATVGRTRITGDRTPGFMMGGEFAGADAMLGVNVDSVKIMTPGADGRPGEERTLDEVKAERDPSAIAEKHRSRLNFAESIMDYAGIEGDINNDVRPDGDEEYERQVVELGRNIITYDRSSGDYNELTVYDPITAEIISIKRFRGDDNILRIATAQTPEFPYGDDPTPDNRFDPKPFWRDGQEHYGGMEYARYRDATITVATTSPNRALDYTAIQSSRHASQNYFELPQGYEPILIVEGDSREPRVFTHGFAINHMLEDDPTVTVDIAERIRGFWGRTKPDITLYEAAFGTTELDDKLEELKLELFEYSTGVTNASERAWRRTLGQTVPDPTLPEVVGPPELIGYSGRRGEKLPGIGNRALRALGRLGFRDEYAGWNVIYDAPWHNGPPPGEAPDDEPTVE